MSDEGNFPVIGLLALFICAAFVLGLIFGAVLDGGTRYKRGQLDYQAGIIEWTIIDGAVHHIEEAPHD